MKKKFRVYTLMYHRVSEKETDAITLCIKDFEQHLMFIKDNYFCPDPAQLVENFKEGCFKFISNRDVVLITFDDGYEDNFRLVRPLLKKYGLKALVFLVSNYTGKYNTWNHKYEKNIRHMNLTEIKKATDVFHYGCHTANHYNITKLSNEDLKTEILGSRDKLGKILGYSIDAFSYPFGLYNKRVADFISNYFAISFSTYNKGKNFDWKTNPYTVRRINPLDCEIRDFPEFIFKFRNDHLYK